MFMKMADLCIGHILKYLFTSEFFIPSLSNTILIPPPSDIIFFWFPKKDEVEDGSERCSGNLRKAKNEVDG